MNVPVVHGYEAAPLPPVCLVEYTRDHVALKTDWYSNPWTLITFAPAILGVPGAFLALYYGFPLMDRLAGRPPLLSGTVLVAVAAAGTMAYIAMLGRMVVTMLRSRGPIHFDQDAGHIRFGPVAAQRARPLKEVAAVEFYPVCVIALQEALVDAALSTSKFPPWLVTITKWTARLDARLPKRPRYQLDLVFADGSRLYLTHGTKPEPIQAVARQLAEFIPVPYIDNAAG